MRIVGGFLFALSMASAQPAFTVTGWGVNSAGQLLAPSQAVEVLAVAAGDAHGVAVTREGRFYAWGGNDVGQTSVPALLTPPQISPNVPPTLLVSAGPRHSLAARGSLIASWGAVTAVPAANGFEFQAVAAGRDFNLGLLITGRVEAAGANEHSQLDVPEAARAGVVAIAAGDHHALALRTDGRVIAWGKNNHGQTNVPAAAERIIAIAAAADFSAALREDRVIIVWGDGADSFLIPPVEATGALALFAGRSFLIASTDAGTVVWGNDQAPKPADSRIRVTTAAGGDGFALAVIAPRFTRTPGVTYADAGSAAQLIAEVSDAAGAAFAWEPAPMGAASASTLSIPHVEPSFRGTYRLTVTYPTGFRLRTAGLLVVSARPGIRPLPELLGAMENESFELLAEADVTSPLLYQWRHNGADIPDATARLLRVSPVALSSAGRYTCVVSSGVHRVESNATRVIVSRAARGSGPVERGDTVTLAVSGRNRPMPLRDYGWAKDGVPIAGATTETLIIPNFAASDAGTYTVSYLDGINQRAQESFVLHLYIPRLTGPGWLVPATQVVRPGAEATVRLAGVGSGGGLNYRWTDAWGRVQEGINLLTYRVEPLNHSDSAFVTLQPGHPDPRRDAMRAAIHASNTAPPVGALLSHSGPSELRAGDRGELIAEFQGPVQRYTWFKDNIVIAGESSGRLVIPAARDEDAGSFRVVATTANGATANSWNLRIVGPPVITQQPRDTILGPDGSARVSVTYRSRTLGADGIHGFRWYRNGVEHFPADRDTLVTRLPGAYRVRVLHEYGVVESEPAVVAPHGGGSAAEVVPGFHFGATPGGPMAALVRTDGTLAIAAVDRGLGWFGESRLDAKGRFALRPALRDTGGDTPLAVDGAFEINGSVTGTQLEATIGPLAGLPFSSSIVRAEASPAVGLYRGKIGGAGELWIFVARQRDAVIFLHDGYMMHGGSAGMRPGDDGYDISIPTLNVISARSNLRFDPSFSTATLSLVVRSGAEQRTVGPCIALRDPVPAGSRFSNLSVRAVAGSGDATLVAGFVITGNGRSNLLVRAVGPQLLQYGLSSAVSDPSLHLFSGSTLLQENDNWFTDRTALNPVFQRTGAFSLDENGRDAALQSSLVPGAYTAVVRIPANTTPAPAVVEVYEDGSSEARLTNLSTRGTLTRGGEIIVGFVVRGARSQRVLIRAIGPALGAFGVGDAMTDPQLVVMRGNDAVALNDNWADDFGAAGQIATAATRVGAFSLTPSSRDAALLVTLTPGAYTVVVTGTSTSTGTVLVEAYDVP